MCDHRAQDPTNQASDTLEETPGKFQDPSRRIEHRQAPINAGRPRFHHKNPLRHRHTNHFFPDPTVALPSKPAVTLAHALQLAQLAFQECGEALTD